MYLKSIEIHGFKSFANKIVFEFKKGITAIVGPNGSGKSNVGDAVRWVLGEQSAKQLRGSKMEDIIFAGTELRKPQGFAYVAITFDNSDHKLSTSYQEVTVARRVYRSGESEYLMNGTNCRLRDIQELFLDTGIGKEGYSIIGQGQIDKILNGKPEERRELFDEAAGIVKYKKRKATAEKNLEAERQNLERIKDILLELEKQVGPLKQQSQVAREYLRLREELKKMDVNVFLQEYEQLHNQLEKMEENLKIVSDEYQEKEKTLLEIKELYENLERQIEQKNQIIENNKNSVQEKRIYKEQLEGRIKVCNEQINASKQNDTHYKTRIQAVEKEIEKKRQANEECLQEKETLKVKMQEVESEKQKNEELLRLCKEQIVKLGNDIDRCNNEIMQHLNKNATLKAKTEKYSIMMEQSSVKKAELTQRILKNKSEEAVYEEIILTEKENLEKITECIEKMQSNMEQIQENVIKEKQQAEELRQEYNQKQQQYHSAKSKIEALKNMTERYEGYGQSIRRIMEQKEHKKGIIGVVADIIKVKKEYEVAIEIALGGSIQNIVTDTENTAKELIQFLKEKRFGRATFLPLSAIGKKGGVQNKEVLKEQGVIGVASSLVSADARFDELVNYLLGKIIVVDQIDHAIAVARKYKNTLRIVTLEGELLNPGGSMSGGAYKNSSNLLSRHREVEDGEKTLEQLQSDGVKLRQNIEQLRESMELQEQQQKELQTELQELYIRQNTASMKYEQAMQESDNIVRNYQLIRQESTEIERGFQEIQSEMEQLKLQMGELESQNTEKEQEIQNTNKILETKKREEESYRELVSKLSIELSALGQQREFSELNEQRVSDELQGLSAEFEHLKNSMQNTTTQVQQREAEILLIKEELEKEEVEISKLAEYVAKLTEDRDDVLKKHKSTLQSREEIGDALGHLDKEIFRLKNQKEKFTEQVEKQMDYMWEEYELTYNSALEHKCSLDMELSDMKKMVSNLKSQIKGLGDVNVNAIEDYKNISGRYESLHEQHEDLIRSEEILKGIVEELDIEMRKQFEEKFDQIKKQFDVVFKELFGGGKGTIELAEDEDILEAGINIIAQPPGKKLQNMMQMSGGEKALTAISLLFAIQNLKPSPFCLLDEIEAALDDSNVKRYAQYLHKLTKDTQFIVITHRRGTMASADTLYGITMQEKGVSTMVSVSLIEDQLEKMEKKSVKA